MSVVEAPVAAERLLGGTRKRALALVERDAYCVLAIALYAFLMLSLLPAELVQDTWLTLVSGREIAQHGLPANDALTVLTHGFRWVDQQWLAQLLFYNVFSVGGLKAILLVHVACVSAAFAIAVLLARRLGASGRATFGVAVAATTLAPWAWQVRAQSLAYLPFVAVFGLLVRDSRRSTNSVLLVVPILVLWGNLHGSVAIGVALAMLRGAFLVGERLYRRGLALLVAAPLSALVSPYGLELVGYYRHMLVNPYFGKFVAEWKPASFPAAAPFFLGAFIAVALLARAGSRVTRFEQAALVALIAEGYMAIRSVSWFALAAVVVLPACIERSGFELRPGRLLRVISATAAFGALAMAAVTFAAPAATLERQWQPAAAADAAVGSALGRDPGARVLASERYADRLLWDLPQLRGRVAFDVRFELNTDEQVRAIVDFRHQLGDRWLRLAAGYDVVVLDGRPDAGIAAKLRRQGWRTDLDSPAVTVLARR